MLTPAQHYSLSALMTSLSTLVLMAVVFLRATDRRLAHYFCWYTFTIAWWSLFVFACTWVRDHTWSYFLCQVCHAGGVFIPVTFLHFVQVYTANRSGWLKSVLLAGYLAVGFVSLAIVFRPRLFVPDVAPKLTFSYFPEPGPLFIFWNILFVVLVFVSALVMIYETSQRRGLERRSLIAFLVANLLGYLGGIGCFFPVYGIGRFPFPFGIWGVFFFSLVTAYAVLRYKLMDIEVIIKKTLVFAGLFGFVSATVSLVVYFLNTYLARFTGLNPTLSTGIAIVIAILLYDPVKTLLVHLTDRFLFQKKEDFRKILNRLSEKIITILDLAAVGKTILDTLKESLRSETGVLLLRNETGYRPLNSFGIGWTQATRVYPPDEALLQYLRDSPGLIDLEFEDTLRNLPKPVLKTLQALKAVLVIPLVLHGELIGVLTLGKKLSDQQYRQDEIEYFPTVAGQAAIALSNARLYGEAVEARKKIETMQVELIHREKMAFVADLVKGIAHEIFNPLLPVFSAIGDLEREVLVGLFQLYKDEENQFRPELRERYLGYLSQLRDQIDTLRRNSRHIHLVIDTLNKLRKEDKETIGPLDFKMFLKDSRALIGMELHGEAREIPVIEDIQTRLPPVKGNPTLLAQVFVNLFKNAIHAMEGKAEPKITIKADSDPEKSGFLKIDFTDTGSGIPADILPRIFDFGFTTKSKKGQGIGLNQCKLIIEKFEGTIDCHSTLGEGAIFTIHLPLWQEDENDKNFNRG